MNDVVPSVCKFHLLDLTNQTLHMSPFKLYLYLKPLYSCRGGSTILADPFIKNPLVVTLRENPLYKWNIFTSLMFVLSLIYNHDSLYNNYKICELMGIAPM